MASKEPDESDDDLDLRLVLELPQGRGLMIGADDSAYLVGLYELDGKLIGAAETTSWVSALEIAIDEIGALEAEFPVSAGDNPDTIGQFDTGMGVERLRKAGPNEWLAELHDYDGHPLSDEDGTPLVWEFASLEEYLSSLAEYAADYGLDHIFSQARRSASDHDLSTPAQQAWIIIGDEASWPSPEELDSQRARPDSEPGDLWTAAKQTEPGDLLLLYFMAPTKAACFVARSRTEAYYSSETGVNSVHSPSDHQWWVEITPLIQIEPISFAKLRDANGDHLILRGRSGKFLRPETIESLTFIASDPADQAALDILTQRPTGRADLPDPSTMSVSDIAALAGGALRLESDVSTYVVEPLLRHVLNGTGLTFQAEYPVNGGRCDYVILDGDIPKCVIEVKLRVRAPDEFESPDVQQAVRYADALKCPAILMDVSEFHFVNAGEDEVSSVVKRIELNQDLDRLRQHLLSN